VTATSSDLGGYLGLAIVILSGVLIVDVAVELFQRWRR
jgi:hypothetical protein